MKKQRPKFSVLIPVYNKEKYLRKCIKSLTKQTYKNFEIVAVDDCSTDGSREKLEELSVFFDNFRLIKNQENQGLSNNRNILINNAIGEYVLFLDPDDYLEPELLERLEQYTQDDEIDIIKYKIRLVNDDENKDKERFNYTRCDDFMSADEAMQYFSSDSSKRYALACSFAIKRSFFIDKDINFPKDARLNEDIATLPIAISRANKIVIMDYVGYSYVRNDDSLTRSSKKITNINEYVERRCSNQIQFLSAIHYAQVGVMQSGISYDTKMAFLKDMSIRANFYDEKMKDEINFMIQNRQGDENPGGDSRC